MKRIIFSVVAGCIVLLANTTFAEQTNIGDTFPSLGRGVRPLGMGNAFLTMKGNDENALFYNPASIRDLSNDITVSTALLPAFLPTSAILSTKLLVSSDKGKEARESTIYALLSMPAEYNYEIFGLIDDVFQLADDLDASGTASGDIDAFETFVDKYTGQFFAIEKHFPWVTLYNKYFALSVITDAKTTISFRNTRFTNFEVKSKNFGGVVLGSAYGFFEDTLEVGAATKVLYGYENEQIITTTDILASSLDEFKESNWKKGMAIGGDIGVKYEIPSFGIDWLDTLRPTIGATYQDIGNTRFFFMKRNGGPEKIPQTVSAGLGIHPRIWEIETSVLVDFREINVKQDFLMKLNAGAEARFPKKFGVKPSIRGGLNQGYPTAGVGVEFFKHAELNVAFFGKEVGQTTHQRGGYRIANEFKWRF